MAKETAEDVSDSHQEAVEDSKATDKITQDYSITKSMALARCTEAEVEATPKNTETVRAEAAPDHPGAMNIINLGNSQVHHKTESFPVLQQLRSITYG